MSSVTRGVSILVDLPVILMVPVEDLERARRFYELKLGLRLLQATQTEAWYECQCGTKLHLYRKPSEAEKVSLVWAVVDIDKMTRQLTQKGIVFEGREDSDKAGSPVAGVGPAWAVSFRDTEGNLVSLVQLQK